MQGLSPALCFLRDHNYLGLDIQIHSSVKSVSTDGYHAESISCQDVVSGWCFDILIIRLLRVEMFDIQNKILSVGRH
jgi:hypothetical protein